MDNIQEYKELLESIIKKEQADNSIIDISKFEFEDATKKGEHYSSVLKKAVLDVKLKSGKHLRKYFLIKESRDSILLQALKVFEREIKVYRDILPPMQDILLEFCDYTEPMWAKCVHFRNDDQLIFQDLTQSGYKMADRMQGINLEHCLIAVRSLAKFHATSVIMKERGLIDEDYFGNHCFLKETCGPFIQNFYSEACKKLIGTIEEKWEPKWKPAAELLKNNLLPNLVNLIKNVKQLDNTKFNVLCHGDCWTNNMLFKYGLDDVTPISVKFVDFQLTFYNTPAFDLQYFLSTSPNLDVRRNSTKLLIEAYHESLIRQLNLYGCNSDTITLNYIMDEMKRLEIFGIATTFTVLPILHQTKEQATLLQEKQKTNDQFKWNFGNTPTDTYTTIMKELIQKAIDNDTFSNL